MSNCPKCGNPVQEETEFCPICGTNTLAAKTQTPVIADEPTSEVVVQNVQETTSTPTQDIVSVVAPAEERRIPVIEETVPVIELAVDQAAAEDRTPEMPTIPVMEQTQEETPARTIEPVLEMSPMPVMEERARGTEVPTMATNPEFSSAASIIPVSMVTTEFSTADTNIPVVPQNAEFSSADTNIPTVPQNTEFSSAEVPITEPAPVAEVTAPNVVPTEADTLAPKSTPNADGQNTEQDSETSAEPSNTKQKSSKGLNKKTLLIIIIAAIVVAGGGILLMGDSGSTGNVPVNPNPTETVATSSVTSNGFKFNLQEGWLIREDGNNVILTNTDETVVIKLESTKTNFSKLTKGIIAAHYNANANFEDTIVDATKISARDAFLVNTTSGTLKVQAYYINGGSNLTLGATIVYQSVDSKTKHEATVTELIGSMSYSDDSIKAISTIEMYSEVFSAYNGVFNYQSAYRDETLTPEIQITERPEIENRVDNQNNEQVENGTIVEESPSQDTPTEESNLEEEIILPETTE